MSRPVEITEYDPGWVRTFEEIRERVEPALAGLVGRVEHVGSTAVPGLAAKPIVDVDVLLLDGDGVLQDAIARLERLGYRHEGDLGVAGRQAFRPPADMPYHHLYVCVPGCEEFARHVAFRDHLRENAEAARRYAELKKALAAQFREDRQAYGEGKRGFIDAALRGASPERGPASSRCR